MWTTFLVALKANLRNRSALFWMTVFPIVLATMFNGLFGGLAEAYELKPVPMAVIEDTRWQQADGARTFVDALAGETESASDDTTYAEIDQKLLTITTVGTVKEAEQRLADGTANGYLTADNNGRLAMTVSRETAVTAKDSTQNSGLDISLAALRSVIDLYNRTDAVTRQTIADNPQAALSRNFWNSVGQNVDMTHETTLTHFQPDEIARYYYALLAMSCMMAMGYSISTVAAAQANLSALGIRRTVAPLSRAKQLVAGAPHDVGSFVGRPVHRIGLYPARLQRLARRTRTGGDPRGHHRLVHDQLSRHPARCGAEALVQHEIRAVDRHLLHAVAVHRTVRRVCHADQRLDSPQRAHTRHHQPRTAGDEPVLRHPVLRQLPAVHHHLHHSAGDERGIPLGRHRNAEEATL